MYDSAWERFSLGKARSSRLPFYCCILYTFVYQLSALREASLVREMHAAGARSVQYLYMGQSPSLPIFSCTFLTKPSLGYYIHSCQKMRYKGDYSPSFLLDPEEYAWYPLATCVSFFEKDDTRYASFAHLEHSLSGNDVPPKCERV